MKFQDLTHKPFDKYESTHIFMLPSVGLIIYKSKSVLVGNVNQCVYQLTSHAIFTCILVGLVILMKLSQEISHTNDCITVGSIFKFLNLIVNSLMEVFLE